MMKKVATPLLVLIAALLVVGDGYMISMSMSTASPVLGGDVITNRKLIYLTNAISFFVGVAVVMLFTLKLKGRHSDLKGELARVEKHVNALSSEVQVPLSHGYAARGRETGDRLISDAADALRQVFGEEAIYRLGGDELVGILENVGEAETRRLFDALDAEVAEFNRRNPERPVPLSIAKGAVTYVPGLYSGYEQIFHQAEDAMYRDQAATKARRGLED